MRLERHDSWNDCPSAPEVGWTLYALRATVHGIRDLAVLAPEERIEISRLLAYTDRHAVTALLAWHLKKFGQLENLDPTLSEALTTIFHAGIARAFTQLNELATVIDTLRCSGISAIAWKGPVLAHRIYGDAAVRESSDLDILLDPACLHSAGLLMQGLGYSREENGSEVRAVLGENHCVSYKHATRGVVIELHQHPFPSSFPFPLGFDDLDLLDNLPHCVGSHSFQSMTPACELLLSSAHAAKHLWSRLAWIADIAKLAGGISSAEAATLDLKARRSHCHRAVEISLLLAEDILEAVISPHLKACFAPSAEAKRIARIIQRRIFNPDAQPETVPLSPSNWISTQILQIRIRESVRDRIRTASCSIHYALSSNENDRDCIPGIRLNRSFALLFRPVRLLVNFSSRIL